MSNVREVLVETLIANGVDRVWGLPGDSLNGVTDAIRTRPEIQWMHVRNEEAAAVAAVGQAICISSMVCSPVSAAECRFWQSLRRFRAQSWEQPTSRKPIRSNCS